MNDQQSSSPVPGPHRQKSPNKRASRRPGASSVSPSGDASGLSDQEAFLTLAMSMSDEASDIEAPDKAPSSDGRHGWTVDSGGDELSARSPYLAAMARKYRGRRESRNWSKSPPRDNQWEVYDGRNGDDRDDDACESERGEIYGRVTEVVDLSQVPVPPVDGEYSDVDLDAVPPPVGRAQGRRLLPPPEKSGTDLDLPPLVFLDSQGEIMPPVRFANTPESSSARVAVDWAEAGFVAAGDDVAVCDPMDRVGGAEPDPIADLDADVDLDETLESDSGPDDDSESVADLDTEKADEQLHKTDEQEGEPLERLEPADDEIRHDAESNTDVLADDNSFAEAVGPMAIWPGSDPDLVLDDAGRMFDQYCGPVIAVVASIADDRRAIDEALHATFLTAWESMDSFDSEEPRGPWMFTLARRMAFEQMAVSQQLGLGATDYPQPSHRRLEVSVDQSWEAWEVRLAVDQLSSTEYDVLRLTHREGLIHPEIANEMSSTVGAVKSRAYSGSRRLIELLDHVIRPDASEQLDDEQASALTWFLAGVADGSDLDGEERSTVKRVRSQLSTSIAWIMPSPDARDRLLAVVREQVCATSASDLAVSVQPEAGLLASEQSSDDNRDVGTKGDLSPSTSATPPTKDPETEPLSTEVDAVDGPGHKAEPRSTGQHLAVKRIDDDRPPMTSIVVGIGLILVAIVVMTNLFGVVDPDDGLARTYQLQPTEIDPDATAVMHLAPSDTGTRFDFEFGGLDPSVGDEYYGVWLTRTADGAVAPLGSFQWDVSGAPVVLSGPAEHDHYDVIVITKSSRGAIASVADPVVLTAAIE